MCKVKFSVVRLPGVSPENAQTSFSFAVRERRGISDECSTWIILSEGCSRPAKPFSPPSDAEEQFGMFQNGLL